MPSITQKLALLLATGAIQSASALDAAGWRSQSIYQILTDRFAMDDGTTPVCDASQGVYCGGTWNGIASKLDYIQGIGATAIWISPVIKNVEGNFANAGEAYHGFWAEDLYSLNSHFGTEDDLKALAAALHARGMYLMVDIAPNHVGLTTAADVFDNFIPFNDTSYYHDDCSIVWNNRKSEQLCRLEGLPDLRTEDDNVRQVYAAWIKDLVTNYSIDGIRVDTALEIEPEFWTDGGVKDAAGVFLLAEINHSDPETLAPYQQYIDGYMDYSSWNWFTDAFQAVGADLFDLYNGTNQLAAMTSIDPSLFGSFVENHDQVRFPYRNGDLALAKNVASVAMLRDGIPIIYYGQEQHYFGGVVPSNREALWLGGYDDSNAALYGWLQQTNKVRAAAAAADATFLTSRTAAVFYENPADRSAVIGFKKGQMFSMFTNAGADAGEAEVYYAIQKKVHGYAGGTVVVDVMNCVKHTVGVKGRLFVQMPDAGLPRVFLPEDQADGLCNNVTTAVYTATSYYAIDTGNVFTLQS